MSTGCRLVPDGPDMVERPTVIALHGGLVLDSVMPGDIDERLDPDRACALLREFLVGNRVDADARVT
jgi:hypothetical protein